MYITNSVIKLIRLYQKTISPDHGFFSYTKPLGHCRFYPSCSQYTHDAITHHGIIKGLFYGLWRILRCNPFNRGGYDPIKK